MVSTLEFWNVETWNKNILELTSEVFKILKTGHITSFDLKINSQSLKGASLPGAMIWPTLSYTKAFVEL